MTEEAKKYPPKFIEATMYWAKLHEGQGETTTTGKTKYSVELGNLSDAAVAWLKECTVEVKQKAEGEKGEEKGRYISATSYKPIVAVLPNGEQVTDEVANGSRCKVSITPNRVNLPKVGWHTYANPSHLTITDLRVYEGGVEAADNIDDPL